VRKPAPGEETLANRVWEPVPIIIEIQISPHVEFPELSFLLITLDLVTILEISMSAEPHTKAGKVA